jgi:hypothetical protein
MGEEGKPFFFGKKNQKTSVSLAARLGAWRHAPSRQSLFASFSSEKEDAFLTRASPVRSTQQQHEETPA